MRSRRRYDVAEKAALLRERAVEATDAKKQRELEMLAEDCEEMAARLEAAARLKRAAGRDLGHTRYRVTMVVSARLAQRLAVDHPNRPIQALATVRQTTSPNDRRAAST